MPLLPDPSQDHGINMELSVTVDPLTVAPPVSAPVPELPTKVLSLSLPKSVAGTVLLSNSKIYKLDSVAD